MPSITDLIMSDEIFCRACLATGDCLKYAGVEMHKRYFDDFKILELEHPRCKWLCAGCIRHIGDSLQFRDRVTDIALLLKEAIAAINNEHNTIANTDPLGVKHKHLSVDYGIDIKPEVVDDDHFDIWSDGDDKDDLPLGFIKKECISKMESDLQNNRTLTRQRRSELKQKRHKSEKHKKKVDDNQSKCGELKRRKLESKRNLKDQYKFFVVLLSREQQIEELKEMAKNRKYQNSVYKCKYCVKGFGYESTYRKHMAVHEPSIGAQECEMCHMYISSRRSFAKHIANHAKRFKCVKCEFTKRTRRGVVEHYGAEHEADKSKVLCLQCGKVFLKKSVLRQHMQYRHAENKERQECEHCGVTFRTIESLRRHMLKHINRNLPEKEKRFPCETCGKRYLNATLLKIHQRSHNEDRNFYCTLCNKFYKSEIILKCHIKYSSKHYDQEKRIPCPHCDKRFVGERNLSRHIEKDHLGIANFKCHLCPKAYYTNNLLRIHVKRSHDKYVFPKVHMCDYCGKSFSMRKNLICHINTHTGEKPFACTECDARFGHSGVLYMHIKLVHRKLKRNAKGKFIAPT